MTMGKNESGEPEAMKIVSTWKTLNTHDTLSTHSIHSPHTIDTLDTLSALDTLDTLHFQDFYLRRYNNIPYERRGGPSTAQLKAQFEAEGRNWDIEIDFANRMHSCKTR